MTASLYREELITHDSYRAQMLRAQNPKSGWCGRCGVPWAVIKPHDTPYGGDGTPDVSGHPRVGIYALCEGCWELLGCSEARIEYYGEVLEIWARSGHPASSMEHHMIGRAVANGG